MTMVIYECELDWMKVIIECGWVVGSSRNVIKWEKTEDMSIESVGEENVAEKNISYRMLVMTGGVYKGWLEVRQSCINDGYGVFALTRFEKGAIITARIPGEEVVERGAVPMRCTLNLGWNWVTKKRKDDIGAGANAIYLEESRVIRASRRILPGTEIVMNEDVSTCSNGLEWLDTLIFAEVKNGWSNWQNRGCFGKVVSGDKSRGYMVKFNDGSVQHMNTSEVEQFALFRKVSSDERYMEGMARKRKGARICEHENI
jgi:hypothetical protein